MTDDAFIPNADELLANNSRYVQTFDDDPELPVVPSRKLAVVACMDSRMDMFQLLGLGHGEAHVIRNGGGVVTDDVIRSLILSQRLLGTREIILVHHTDCGMTRLDNDDLLATLETETGIRPKFTFEAFSDPFADTRQSMRRLLNSPFIAHKELIRGFVYHVEDGHLAEVFLEP